jgi:signal transduction histidine kinase
LINNSIRHGKANRLSICLKNNTKGFIFKYQDNGIGFNTKKLTKKPGIGIQGIKSRVKILNGTLNIVSNKSDGSTFTIRCKYP